MRTKESAVRESYWDNIKHVVCVCVCVWREERERGRGERKR